MGKRQRAQFAGLSQIARQVFGEQPAQPPPTPPSAPEPLNHTPPADLEQTPIPSAATDDESPIELSSTRPSKRRRAGSKTGNGRIEHTEIPIDPKYNASGLVPYYRSASEVPEHLQKCSWVRPLTPLHSHTDNLRHPFRLLPTFPVLFSLCAWLPARRRRLVQCHTRSDRHTNR